MEKEPQYTLLPHFYDENKSLHARMVTQLFKGKEVWIGFLGSIGNSGNGFRRRPKQQRNTRKTAMMHDNKQYKQQRLPEKRGVVDD